MEKRLVRVLEDVLRVINSNNLRNFNVGEITGVLEEVSKRDTIDYTWVLDQYNTRCKSLPKLLVINSKRRTSIRARVKEFSKEKLVDVFKLAEASNFLSGRETKWRANFDWLINPTNFTKVLEGNYLNKGETSILEEQVGAPAGYSHFSIDYRGTKIVPTSWKNGRPFHKNLALDILLKKKYNDK